MFNITWFCRHVWSDKNKMLFSYIPCTPCIPCIPCIPAPQVLPHYISAGIPDVLQQAQCGEANVQTANCRGYQTRWGQLFSSSCYSQRQLPTGVASGWGRWWFEYSIYQPRSMLCANVAWMLCGRFTVKRLTSPPGTTIEFEISWPIWL